MQEIWKNRTFPALVESIPEIGGFVEEVALRAGLDPGRILHLQLVTDEVVSNVCRYAYKEQGGQVGVSTGIRDSRFILEFSDEGIPFDPLGLLDPDTKAGISEREPGGLGVFLVRRIMDEVCYRRQEGKNVLTLILHLPG